MTDPQQLHLALDRVFPVRCQVISVHGGDRKKAMFAVNNFEGPFSLAK